MKVSLSLFLVFIFGISFLNADRFKDKLNEKVSSVLQSKSKAMDAVDTVLNLLNDLKQSNINEQATADTNNATQESEGLQQIDELVSIRDKMNQILNDASAHRNWVETQLNDAKNYIQWILKRQSDVLKQLDELSEHRCYSNAMFVKALKEHNDAIKVIASLISDLQAQQNAGSQTLEETELHSISNKLKEYTSLFNKDALNNFLALSTKKENYEDNEQEVMDVPDVDATLADSDLSNALIGKVVTLLQNLQAHLKESMQNLQDHEIQANYDFANWQESVEAENTTLNAELDRKNKYQNKLKIDLDVAKSYEDKAQKDYEQSLDALEDARDDLNAKREYFNSETARRNEENRILDEVISIFQDKVAGISEYLRQRLEGDSSRITRRTDEQVAYELGNVAEAVSQEAETQ